MPRHVPPPDSAPARVLVVDDDAVVREFVALTLTTAGYMVTTAPEVDAAVAQLATHEFEVALVDIDIPGRSGLELLSEIHERGWSVSTVLLTGTTDVRVAVEGMKRGALDFLAKPAHPHLIRWTVARAAELVRSRRRERLLEQVASDWVATFDACPDVMLVLDATDHVVRANRAAGELFDRPRTDLSGRPLGAVSDVVAVAVTTGRQADDGRGVPAYASTRDTHLLVTVHPVRGAIGSVVVARDVSEAVRTKDTQNRLHRQLLTAQEDERRRFAQELHDGIGQVLSSLTVGLTLAADRPEECGRQDDLRHLARLASEASQETRRLARGLRPSVLDDLGLEAALKRLTHDFTRAHGVRVELMVVERSSQRPPSEVESAAYRIAQEALTNVARHAAARSVDVVLDAGGGELRLSIVDDGVGFDPAAKSEGGCGLSGMRERVGLLGGQIRINSEPGRGTAIDAMLPTGRNGP